jgi:hypothetical protein
MVVGAGVPRSSIRTSPLCYKVFNFRFHPGKQLGWEIGRAARVVKSRIPGCGFLYTYGTISRAYASGNAARARGSALVASGCASKTPVKTTK